MTVTIEDKQLYRHADPRDRTIEWPGARQWQTQYSAKHR